MGDAVDQLDGAKATPHIGASTAAFEGGKKKVDKALRQLTDSRAEPTMDLLDGPFQTARAHVSNQLADLTKPRSVTVTANVDVAGAWAKLRGFFAAAKAGPSVGSTSAAEPKKKATGGLVTGPGGPTDDVIPALLSNREYVIPASAVSKYGVGFFDAIRAERLATGGQPGKKKSASFQYLDISPISDLVKQLDFDHLGKSVKRLTKSFEESKETLEGKLSARKSVAESLASSVTGKFTSDLFGNTDVWSKGGSLSDAIAMLQGDIAGAKAFGANADLLRSKGLTGSALDALLQQADPATVANIAATATAEQLADYSRLFAERVDVTAAAAATAQAAAGYTAEIVRMQAQLDQVNAHLAALNGIQKDIQKTGPAKTGKATAHASKKGASKAGQNIKKH